MFAARIRTQRSKATKLLLSLSQRILETETEKPSHLVISTCHFIICQFGHDIVNTGTNLTVMGPHLAKVLDRWHSKK